MNKDINIVLNGADAAAASFDVADGVVSIDGYSFPWKKIQKVIKTVSAAAVESDYKFTPTGVADGSVHSFYITQGAGDNSVQTIQVSYTANASDTVATVCDQLIVIINALESTGLIDVDLTDNATDIDIDGTATNPFFSISGAQGGTLAVTAAGSEAVNEGADLLARGIADSFDSDLPASGTTYTLYDWSLKLPKGKGGFNGQTDDQDVSLKLFVQDGQPGTLPLVTEIDNVLAGLNPGGTGSDELLGQD
jgi:hypothetical protein